MKDLIPIQDEYANLGWDIPKRNDVLSEFIQVIKKNLLIGFGVGVEGDAWRDFRKRHRKLPDAQFFCFSRIMRMVVDRMKIADPHDWINVNFDTDRDFAPPRIRLFEEIRMKDDIAKPFLNAISFANPKVILPLQAADLLAWETRKELIQKSGGYESTPRYRELFAALAGQPLDYDSELWTKEEIENKVDLLLTMQSENSIGPPNLYPKKKTT